jgi:uncharacterized protein DUF4190/zinc ribbon protein
MYCTQCGTANSDDIRFCMNCGASMVKRGDTPKDRSPYASGQPQSPNFAEQSPNPQYLGQSPAQPYPAYPGAQQVYPMPSNEGSASGRAVISMILSIISPFTCWLFLSIPGMILGKMEMNAIENGQASKAGEVFAKIGFYVGLAVTALSLVIPVLWLILKAIGAFAF